MLTGVRPGEGSIDVPAIDPHPAAGVVGKVDFEPDLVALRADQAAFWGFRAGARGTHTSRTIMLRELSLLLEEAPSGASRDDYTRLVIDENCLGKRTAATRKLSLQRLTELYGLDRRMLLFRVLGELWTHHESTRPLLALLLALARDPLLRATAAAVLGCPCGGTLCRQSVTAAVSRAAGDRLNPDTVDKVVRNAASSWTQSGHLRGTTSKVRQRVQATPAVTAYALLLGFAAGGAGQLLFETPWCAVLDAETGELMELAAAARRIGLLDLKQSGAMIEVSFGAMLARTSGGHVRGAYRQAG